MRGVGRKKIKKIDSLSMKKVCISVRCAVAASILLVAGPVAADLYVYQGPDGTRWITDHRPLEPGYRLVKRYRLQRRPKGCSLTDPGTVRARALQYDGAIRRFSQAFDVDRALIQAVIHVESCFEPRAVSRAGAVGLMQLMPQTARRYGVSDSYDPAENMRGGIQYLGDLLRMFGNNTRLALAAYNAGENAVRKHGGIPPYKETRAYVPRVLKLYRRYKTAW